jgi:hypothetical protein
MSPRAIRILKLVGFVLLVTVSLVTSYIAVSHELTRYQHAND